jgi:uncharacterized protein (DUF305 family)
VVPGTATTPLPAPEATLAERIKAARVPEIATMSGWLQGWRADVPDPFATGAVAGMHGEHMMSAAEMAQLRSAAGQMADRMFLTMMPKHHEGAITMAQQELSSGANPEAKGRRAPQPGNGVPMRYVPQIP